MSQFLLSLVTSAAYFWKVQNSIKYQHIQNEAEHESKTGLARKISDWLLGI